MILPYGAMVKPKHMVIEIGARRESWSQRAVRESQIFNRKLMPRTHYINQAARPRFIELGQT